jgi:acetyl-CoA C-acetyltransferase
VSQEVTTRSQPRRRRPPSYRGCAASVGIAELKPTREMNGETRLGLMTRIGLDAIRDSGIPLNEVDGLVTHGLQDAIFVPALVAESMGLRLSFGEVLDLGGASAAGMIWRAAAAIATGMCETCVCITATLPTHPLGEAARAAGRAPSALGWGPHTEFDVPYGGVGVNWAYANIAQRYMYEFGVTSEQLAKVAVYERSNACANPDAYFFGQPITVEDVLASPVVADPLHLLDIVMPMGGAAAVVITASENVAGLPNRPVYLLGAGEHISHWSLSTAPSVTTSGVKAASDRAFDMAGIGREQIGLACPYDCYTHVVLISLEDAGFCEKGDGGRFVDAHDFTWQGDFPVNTHGGQLSFGQAGIAGGMSHVTEAVRQLQGRADGRQVENLEYAWVNNNGGMMSEEVSLILGLEA